MSYRERIVSGAPQRLQIVEPRAFIFEHFPHGFGISTGGGSRVGSKAR
jgi:hypothetical protein